MCKVFILPNSVGKPTLIGIYAKIQAHWNLVESYEITYPLSDGLVPLFVNLCKKGIVFDSLYFVRGPGSFMALKLIYLFAKTLEIAQNVKLYATHAFYFNKNSPIKAYGNYYFIYGSQKLCKSQCSKENLIPRTLEKEAQKLQITLQNFDTPPQIQPFALPDVLNLTLFDTQLKPLYLLPPI